MEREASPKLLVVSRSDDGEELAATLRQSGFAEIHLGDGGDDTLAQAREVKPDVVVLCAGIEHGDARALASALRREERPPPVVLVGQRSGPVKNALDAAAFDVDQFVGRPLSAKALAFAVSQCARSARRAGDSISQATDVAIDDIVRDAMASLSAEPDSPSPGSAEVPGGVPDRHVAPAGPDEVTAEHVPSGRDAIAVEDRIESGAVSPWDGDEDDDELPPWREPTVVLSAEEGDAKHASGDGAAWPDGGPKEPSRIGLAELAAMDAQSGEETPAAGDAAGYEGDDGRDPGFDDDGDGDGGFAGQLRRKMSKMAQRLFPDQRVDAGRAVGWASSPHTEIDLADLGVDTVVGQRDDPNLIGGELNPSPTFADAETRVRVDSQPDDAQETSTSAVGGADAKLPARGEIGGAGLDVATILAARYRGGFTGHVVFSRGAADKRVHFVEGRPVFATSNLPHDRMAELLVREGKITREQHARCWQVVVESGRRMGEILVEMGFLKRRELLPAVRRHVEDIIYSVFAWEEGEYVAIPEDVASGEKIRLSRHPAAIILEGVRRKYTWHALEAALGTADAVVVTGGRDRVDEILASADLSPPERALVTSLGGDRSLGEAADDKGVDLLLAYQLAFGLIALGAAQLVHKGGESRPDVDAARAPSLVGETDLAIDRQRVLAKRALVDEADYFTLLGVRRDATRFEIRRAYEAARREYAPGSFPAEVQGELGDAIGEINELLDEAFHVLDDDDLRAAYLAHLFD